MVRVGISRPRLTWCIHVFINEKCCVIWPGYVALSMIWSLHRWHIDSDLLHWGKWGWMVLWKGSYLLDRLSYNLSLKWNTRNLLLQSCFVRMYVKDRIKIETENGSVEYKTIIFAYELFLTNFMHSLRLYCTNLKPYNEIVRYWSSIYK